ncbi:translin family protein [Geoglobus acetivorans]|uniref:Haloacid dehalogenase n=1 Tax=Geoglobus acetivorans TaxID=565033 RepID=A0A0A7GC88_GEOAI|nr:hypothetical protein GACE_0582 [Geoglobus acetivorans]
MRDEIFEEIRRELEEKEKIREEIIVKSRTVRLNSSKAIANVHKGNLEAAEEYLSNALSLARDLLDYREKHPDQFYLAHDALQELVEAYTFTHIVRGLKIPERFPVSIPQALLPGMADCVGELRRFALTMMVKGESDEKIRKVVEIMEELYHILIEFDFHDRLTGNLRPKLDVARNSIERTKSDLLSAKLINLLDK